MVKKQISANSKSHRILREGSKGSTSASTIRKFDSVNSELVEVVKIGKWPLKLVIVLQIKRIYTKYKTWFKCNSTWIINEGLIFLYNYAKDNMLNT